MALPAKDFHRTPVYPLSPSSVTAGFDQGLAFFLPNQTWLQPPGHVHAMFAQAYGDQGLGVNYVSGAPEYRVVNKPITVRDPKTGELVTRMQPTRVAAAGQTISAQKSSATGEVFVRVTNAAGTPTPVSIAVTDATVTRVTVWTLSANTTSTSNSPQAPNTVTPVRTTAGYPSSGPFIANVPAYSFTVFAFTTA